jgi:hypothetical protein
MSVNVKLLVVYMIGLVAFGLSLYAVLRVNSFEPQEIPVTQVMIITPSPVPTLFVSPTLTATPTATLLNKKAIIPSVIKAE